MNTETKQSLLEERKMIPDSEITLENLIENGRSAKKTAILDLNFSLLWTNDKDFFGTSFNLLDRTSEIIDTPIKRERIISVRNNGKTMCAELLPIIDGVDVKCYLLSMQTTENLLNMISHSQLSESSINVVNVLKSDLNRIISIAGMLEGQFEERKMVDEASLIKRQLTSAERMLTNCNNLIDLLEYDVIKPKENLIYVSEVLESIYYETQKCLSSIKRLIDFSKPEEDALINFNEKKFTSAVMNLIQNALLYSPPKSSIGLRLTYEKGQAVIRITNTFLSEQKSAYDIVERANVGKRVAAKLVSECNGTVSFYATDNTVTSEIMLPIINGEVTGRLSSSFDDFIAERYKPVHLFLNEIIENEKK